MWYPIKYMSKQQTNTMSCQRNWNKIVLCVCTRVGKMGGEDGSSKKKYTYFWIWDPYHKGQEWCLNINEMSHIIHLMLLAITGNIKHRLRHLGAVNSKLLCFSLYRTEYLVTVWVVKFWWLKSVSWDTHGKGDVNHSHRYPMEIFSILSPLLHNHPSTPTYLELTHLCELFFFVLLLVPWYVLSKGLTYDSLLTIGDRHWRKLARMFKSWISKLSYIWCNECFLMWVPISVRVLISVNV